MMCLLCLSYTNVLYENHKFSYHFNVWLIWMYIPAGIWNIRLLNSEVTLTLQRPKMSASTNSVKSRETMINIVNLGDSPRKLVSRYYDLVCRIYDLVCRIYEFVSRYYDLASRYHNLVSRNYELVYHYDEIPNNC